jgi:tRNA(Ile)-lysidine synthase TilS/MesJ
MVYVEEKEIIRFVNRNHLPVVVNPCPVDKHTKREDMKHTIERMSKEFPDIRDKFILAIERPAETWAELEE